MSANFDSPYLLTPVKKPPRKLHDLPSPVIVDPEVC